MDARLKPKLITVLREGYSKDQFYADLISGIIVGIVSLPLAIAFAIASGVKPEQGLYTAIIAGFVIAVLGGSRVQVSGPTGAFIVVVYGIVQQYGYNGLAIATFIAGILLILMGLSKMGAFLKFIPYPVTVGFTSGIAVIIFSSQIRDFFGLRMEKVPADFIEKWTAYAEHFQTYNFYALITGIVSLIIIIYWPRITHKIPGALVAILIVTTIVQVFNIPVETIGSRFGNVPNHFPSPQFPHLTWKLVTQLFSPAITIAILGAIESLLAAVVADGMLGTRHRSNMELIAQGVGNVISPIFGGIPATGAIARTATNIKSGGRTPVAGIIHALTLLFIMLFFGKWASLIPLATLASILVVVAYNMSEWHTFVKTFKTPRSDIAVLLTTFFLTVLIDLTVAIEVGVVLAAFLFLRRMMNVTQLGFITKDLQENNEEDKEDNNSIYKRKIPKEVEIFEIYGPLFFGVIDQFKETLSVIEKKPKVLILRMRNMLAIDAAGLAALEDIHKWMAKEKTHLILSDIHAQPLMTIEQSGILSEIKEENVFGNIDDALNHARKILGLPQEEKLAPFIPTVERELVK